MLQERQIVNLAFGNGYLGIFNSVIPLLRSLFVLASVVQAWQRLQPSLSILIAFARRQPRLRPPSPLQER
jgi:hypothetical protein